MRRPYLGCVGNRTSHRRCWLWPYRASASRPTTGSRHSASSGGKRASGPKFVVDEPRFVHSATWRQSPDRAKRRTTIRTKATGRITNFRSEGLLVTHFLTSLTDCLTHQIRCSAPVYPIVHRPSEMNGCETPCNSNPGDPLWSPISPPSLPTIFRAAPMPAGRYARFRPERVAWLRCLTPSGYWSPLAEGEIQTHRTSIRIPIAVCQCDPLRVGPC